MTPQPSRAHHGAADRQGGTAIARDIADQAGAAGTARPFHLRPARPFDAAACARIVNDWIDATSWMPRIHDPAEIAWHFREEVFRTRDVTVAEARGEVAGFLALDRDAAVVTALYVAARAQGGGIGAALLRAARAGLPRLSLWTFEGNTGARRFYAREGFIQARRSTDNAEALPDVELVWAANRSV